MDSQASERNSEEAVAIEVSDNNTMSKSSKSSTGGWSTAPFIIGSAFASFLAMYGISTDLLPYLDRRFNIKDIRASQITNIINSLMNLTPVVGAVLCDSFLGCFYTISVFTFISFLGATLLCGVLCFAFDGILASDRIPKRISFTVVGSMMLMLTALLPSLGPPPCDHHALGSCQQPSTTQFAFLCIAFAVTALGAAGASFTYVTIGGNQFDKKKDQEVFVNWFFFATTLAMLLAFMVVVYVLDNVGWDWGYGLCALLNAIGLVLFLLGKLRYRGMKPKGSPFASLARVMVAATRKNRINLTQNEEQYYCGDDGKSNPTVLTSNFSFFNKASLITKGDNLSDGSVTKSWSLCTIQEVEDLKCLLKLLPLWSSGIFISVASGIQTNLTILQSLTMNRSLGSHFKIPAASFQVFALLSMVVCLPVIDRFFYPVCRSLIRRTPTALHKIGVGHAVNIVGMAAMAYVESRRLQTMHSHGLEGHPFAIIPISALWLVPPLALIGASTAFYMPGRVSLYYQEFPASLKSTGTSMMSLTMGLGLYLSTMVVDVVRRATGWLNDDINKGRLDNVYWMLTVLGGLNLIYYLVCAKMYKLQSQR